MRTMARHWTTATQVRERCYFFLGTFIFKQAKNDRFTKTGSGQTQGLTQKGRFLADAAHASSELSWSQTAVRKKRLVFSPFCTENLATFYQDKLGTNIGGKAEKETILQAGQMTINISSPAVEAPAVAWSAQPHRTYAVQLRGVADSRGIAKAQVCSDNSGDAVDSAAAAAACTDLPHIGTPTAGAGGEAWTEPVRKTPLFAPFIYKNDHFTKTGSGQT
jgi:hypothetical protein